MTSLKAQDIFDLEGAIALVTGGGTGIGLMSAKALAANGAKVYITGRRGEVLEQAIKAHSSGLRGSLYAIQGDVSSKDDLKRIASKVEEGHLHILVNNAGIVGPCTRLGEKKAEMSETEYSQEQLNNETFEEWEQTYRINTSSLFFSTMTFLPLLEAGNKKPPTNQSNKWSSGVINITSISGIVKISQNHYAYNSSKAAANSITMMLSHELRYGTKSNIRVNALAPGVFPSEMTSKSSTSKDGVTSEDDLLETLANPAGRPGTIDEMASGILFLATNNFTTGQILAIDGGFISAVASSR